MIKYLNHDIVFQEFPDEVTLAINLTLCPNGCPGCHSAILQGDIGEALTPERLFSLIDDYKNEITCVGLMGGDNDVATLQSLLSEVRKRYGETLMTGWYSGRPALPQGVDLSLFDYIKLGPYEQACGPLKSKTTNQRLYRVGHDSGQLEDITSRFWK